ncbi:MAG: 30S ribosomal protein S6--L-glutamate ligase [Gammaproteobacteria bacterium]
MRIAILSLRPKLYSTCRLVEAAQQRGHQVEVINSLHCYMNITSHRPSVHYQGKALLQYDAVIPRIGASITFYGAAVVRQFEMMGVFCVNSSIAITRSRDKLRALQLLSRKGLGLPITGYAHSPEDIHHLIKMVGGAPLLIKLLEGTQGIGVILADSTKAAKSVAEAFFGLRTNFLLQEYIQEAHGADIRCFVVDGEVVAAMRRQAHPNEFRSNIHRGGKASFIEITAEERQTAEQAAKVMGLNVAGVDLLRSQRGPLVLEVNSSPGLEGIETVTNEDIAGKIIKFIETHAKPITPDSPLEG